MERNVSLDNLKAILPLFVILTHSDVAFLQWSYWPVQDNNPEDYWPYLGMMNGVLVATIMPLFFFMSGYFMPYSYEKNGCVTFLKKKFLRIGLPFLIFTLLNSLLYGSYFPGHLWYLQHIMFLSVIYAIVKSLLHINFNYDKLKPNYLNLLIIVFFISVFSVFIRRYYHYVHAYTVFFFIWGDVSHYQNNILFFLLGIVYYHNHWVDRISYKVGVAMIVLGLSVIMLYYYYVGINYNFYWNSNCFCIVESVLCIFFCVGLLVVFRSKINKQLFFTKKLLPLSFGVYIFHLWVVYAAQYYIVSTSLNIFMKLLFVNVVSVFVVYMFTWIIRKLPYVSKII